MGTINKYANLYDSNGVLRVKVVNCFQTSFMDIGYTPHYFQKIDFEAVMYYFRKIKIRKVLIGFHYLWAYRPFLLQTALWRRIVYP